MYVCKCIYVHVYEFLQYLSIINYKMMLLIIIKP